MVRYIAVIRIVNSMKLGKFDCSTGLINVLYNDEILNISVRTSTIKDMLLVDKLQKENSYAVGFIQKIFGKIMFGVAKEILLY